MVIGYYGPNGSCKTLCMTREFTGYQTVFCNYHYQAQPYQKVCYDVECSDLFEKLRCYCAHRKVVNGRYVPERICLGIDEAGLNFPARSWKSLSKSEAGLFAQHRKWGIDLLYTAQHFRMVDSILRNNTFLSGYPSHFFSVGWCKYYDGFERSKDAFQYLVTFWLPAYFKMYNTLELVESTKFYFAATEGYDIDDIHFTYGGAVAKLRAASSGSETGAATTPALREESNAETDDGDGDHMSDPPGMASSDDAERNTGGGVAPGQ